MQGVGSSPAKIKNGFDRNSNRIGDTYTNLSPSTNPAKIKQEITEMQRLAKDSSDPGKGINGKKHLLASAEHAYRVDEGYVAGFKKKKNYAGVAIFSALANKERATIKKIEKQRGIEKYTFDGNNTPPKNNIAPKVKKKVPGENFK